MVWQQPIIGIKEDDIGRDTCAQSRIAGSRKPLIVLPDVSNRPIPMGDFGRLVGRAIVDDDDVKAPVGLPQDALNRFAQIVRLIKAGNDDRHDIPIGHSAFILPIDPAAFA